ncbi:MAG: DNA polymerase III subunit delta [Candidatus Binatia bacterium]
MKRDLKTVLADLKAGRGPQLLLVFGDDLRVVESCRAILNQMVPEEQRGFNFERFDGRAASWEQIESSLMTPPFFLGKKLLWVDGAPYFYAREQKGEFGERILELWRDGKREDAAKLLLDLLVLEAWTQEQWNGLDGASIRPFLDLLGAGSVEDPEGAEALLAFCKSRPLDLGKRKGAEAHRLATLLDQGLPEWSFLLLTAVQVDRRTRLFKRFEELGAVLYLGLERDRSGKISRESLLEFVSQRLREAGKNVEPQAREMILARAGDDLRGLQQELEKLLLFIGDRSTIRVEDVELMVADRGEGWIFDLTRALGDRDAATALAQLARLIAQGEHPLKILGTIAAEARRLLLARQILTGDLAKLWRRGMTYQQFQQSVLKQGTSLLGRNPYGDYVCLQRAERFSMAELRSFMERLLDADLRLKSSGSQPRIVLEKLFLEMCLGARRRGPDSEGVSA